MLAWVALLMAAVAEIGWVLLLKRASSTGNGLWYALTYSVMFISVILLAYAMRSIPMGTAYAIWTGIGAFGVAILGIVFYAEAANPARLICLLAIIGGVIGLKLTSPA